MFRGVVEAAWAAALGRAACLMYPEDFDRKLIKAHSYLGFFSLLAVFVR